LLACSNPLLAEERKRKREDLLQATEKSLTRIVTEVERRKHKFLSATEIAVKVGKVLGRYKMSKHFACAVEEGKLSWQRKQECIEEAKLDGICVIRASEAAEQLSVDDTVRGNESLSSGGARFPLSERLGPADSSHSPSHRATTEDEELPATATTPRPGFARQQFGIGTGKKSSQQTAEGFPVHSFATLLPELGTRARLAYRWKTDESAPSFQQVPPPNPLQTKAYD
jgi:hypothetical protein